MRTLAADKPTDEQLAALQRFARTRGTYWRAQLRRMWEQGYYRGVPEADHALLQQVRNTVGPSGLAKVQLPVADATAYLKAHETEKARVSALLNAPGKAHDALSDYDRTHRADGGRVPCPTCPRASASGGYAAYVAGYSQRGTGQARCAACRGQGALGFDYDRDCTACRCTGSVPCPTCNGEGLVACLPYVEADHDALKAAVRRATEAAKGTTLPGAPQRGDVVIVAKKCKLPLGTLGAFIAKKTWDDGNTSAGVLLPTGEVGWVPSDAVEVALAVSDEERNDITAAFEKNREEFQARRAQGGR